MGDRDKGTVIWRGLPLVAHVINRLKPQVGKILISCNRNAGFYANYAETTFSDLRTGYQGPLAGLEAAARHIETEFVLIAPCDTPLLPADLVPRLLAELLSGERDGCYARSGDRNHYLCALLKRACLESVSSYLDDGGRTVRHWYAAQDFEAVELGEDTGAFANINQHGG